MLTLLTVTMLMFCRFTISEGELLPFTTKQKLVVNEADNYVEALQVFDFKYLTIQIHLVKLKC